jgi:sporulation protein YlmC with PRC-barrel domain
MERAVKSRLTPVSSVSAVVLGLAACSGSPTTASASTPGLTFAQAMVPPTGMMEKRPMPMNERMLKRFPQPVQVSDLIGLPVLDNHASTLGYVREVVRTANGNIELIVSYSRWWGWFGHPVAVPIEVVGIAGRQIYSLDMSREEYAKAVNWRRTDEAILPNDASIRIALARA